MPSLKQGRVFLSKFAIKGKDMADNLIQQKIDMWKTKLVKLEKEYDEIMIRRGEAMKEGDLRENAAFQMADEDASTYNVRMDEVKKIIAKLESELAGGKVAK